MYRRALELNPSHASAHVWYSRTLWGLGRMDEALARARRGVKLDPLSAIANLTVAQMLAGVGRFSESEARWPNDFYSKWCAMRIPLLAGDRRPALDRWSKFLPEVVGPGPLRIDVSNAWSATTVAALLVNMGESDRARMILDAAEPYMLRKTRLGYLGYGIEEVYVHALRGRRREALLALREAEKAGWRFNWRESLLHPALDSIRDDPEFEAVVADIERDVARQRAELARRPSR